MEQYSTEMVLDLVKPLQPLAGQGDTISQLHLREPTCGELAAAMSGANGIESDILLIAKICSLPPAQVRELSATDYTRAANFLGGFSRRALATGSSS